MFRGSARLFIIGLLVVLASGVAWTTAARPRLVRVPGHLLPALAKATVVPSKPNGDAQPITLTLVLKRDDQTGFERYLKQLYDPHSPNFRHFLTQSQIADRFGPSREDYDDVVSYLRSNGLPLIAGAKNRLTVTVRGTRGAAERAFNTKIDDYRIGSRTFQANSSDPQLPPSLAARIEDVAGLSNLAQPHRVFEAIDRLFCSAECRTSLEVSCASTCNPLYQGMPGPACDACLAADQTKCIDKCVANKKAARAGNSASKDPGSWLGMNGAGQTVGLVEFDTYNPSDVSDFVALAAADSNAANVTEVNVDGGATIGPGESEVLLDIDAILSVANGAKVVVYDAPFTGASSFQAAFSAAINGNSTIISNSWAACEDQVSAADAQGIDSLFQTAAAQGITIVNGAGDTGSTCLDGSPNTISVPADSPNATAVGGSSLTNGPTYIYGSEKWWDGTLDTPPTGQGGFGSSKYFARPSYQASFNSNPMRSIPDVVDNADPANGVAICQEDAGGCPTGLLYGGTSVAAPQWAAYIAILNEAVGHNLGFLNSVLYPLGGTDAFHTAESMGSDFMHVGLGSPNLDVLQLMLNSAVAGTPDAGVSDIQLDVGTPEYPAIPGVYADGTSSLAVVVTMRDTNGNSVSGKSVTLAANGGSNAQITPSNAVTNVANGSAAFSVTDTTAENLTFTATDTTDGIQVTQQLGATFEVPPASAASIAAAPPSVNNDGKSQSTITITLKDSLGRATPGKLINLLQTGHAVIAGPSPQVTDANGNIQFFATDVVSETVTFTAVDVTDANSPVPGSASTNFTGSPSNTCGSGLPPAAPGFVVTPYATGFSAQSISAGDVNFGCWGASGIAFDSSGNLYVNEFTTGNVYKFPPGGGVAGPATLLNSTSLGVTLSGLVFDSSGNLFASRDVTTGNFTTGDVIQLNSSTGAIISSISTGLTCPTALAVDPLTGDLFTDDSCTGSGSDNSSIWRISSPASAPSTSVYANLPATPNANLAFTPGGTFYAWADNGVPGVVKVTGTNGPTPPTVTPLSGLQLSYLGLLAGGAGNGTFLIANPFANNANVGINVVDLTTSPLTLATSLATTSGANNMTFGPGGCIYASQLTTVFKITAADGSCNYASSLGSPTLVLSPTSVSPNPAQGTSQTFAASFHFASAPDGTPVVLSVSGANPQTLQTNTTGGVATFSYIGARAGVDTLSASATLNSSPLRSNDSVVTWGAGTDVTFLALNQSPNTATSGQPVNLKANLTDVSLVPATEISGEQISLSLGNAKCSAPTDANGNAACQVTAASAGITTLSANFAGTSQYNPASASQGVTILGATPTPNPTPPPTPTPTPPPTPTPTPTATPTPVIGTDFSANFERLRGKAGDQVSTSFSAANNTGAYETISSVTLDLSDPQLLSALSVSANEQTGEAAGPIGDSNQFTFDPPLRVANGQSITFDVTATIASGTAMIGGRVAVALAATSAKHAPKHQGLLPLFASLGLLGFGMVGWRSDRRKRSTVGMLALVLVFAAIQAGCNDSGNSSPPPNSPNTTISVTAAVASGADGATSGLPLDVARVIKQ
jgi:kumamolisin